MEGWSYNTITNVIVHCLTCLTFLSEMMTVSGGQQSSPHNSSVDIETDTGYLQLAKKGGGHNG